MIRNHLSKHLGGDPYFKWRGHEVSRIEAFSDSVFAFAVTLVIVSLEVPKSFSQLQEVMKGFVGFAACFALMLWIWYEHFRFFRRYGLQDLKTIVLNASLLFVILFYSFPLKFVFGYVINRMFGLNKIEAITQAESAQLMYFFNIGFFAVTLIFWMLYRHAWKSRLALELTEIEQFDTRTGMLSFLANMTIAVLSTLLLLLGDQWSPIAGLSYWLVGPSQGILGYLRGKKRRKMEPRGTVAQV